MDAEIDRLEDATSEKHFADIVAIMDMKDLELVRGRKIGKQFLTMCTSNLSKEAVSACVKLSFLSGMNTEACLATVQKALCNPAYKLTPAHVMELEQCCSEMRVAARAFNYG